jgi:hypothetical protein
MISKLVISYANRVMNMKEASNQFMRQVFIDQLPIFPPVLFFIRFCFTSVGLFLSVGKFC